MTGSKGMTIRPGQTADAAAAVEVLRRSITELCKADHGDDPAEFASWLANKTEETWRTWVKVLGATLLVAEADGRMPGSR